MLLHPLVAAAEVMRLASGSGAEVVSAGADANGAATQQSGSGGGLTKNQKKRLKRKQKKAAVSDRSGSGPGGSSQGPTPSGDSCITSVLHDEGMQDDANSVPTGEPVPLSGLKRWLSALRPPSLSQVAAGRGLLVAEEGVLSS